MSALRQRMIEDLQLRNYSPSTIETYTYHVACFAKHFGKSPDRLGPEEISAYQLHLVRDKQASWSTFNQTVCALRFFYRHTCRRPWHVEMILFGKKPKKLPSVLSADEVGRLLACVKPLKPRTVLLTLYAAGLRLSEALHLEVSDIDSARMQLRVARGKGNKQRLVPLSPRLLEALREYWRQQRPHRSFSSTLIYLHVRRPHLQSTPSPLDWLPVEQCPHWTRPEPPQQASQSPTPQHRRDCE